MDCSRAPLGFNEGTWQGVWAQDEKPIAWARLTAPVAYLTSVPFGPFSLFGPKTGDTGAGFRTWKVYIYRYMVNDPARSAAMTAARNLGFSRFMNSLGPMRTNWQPWVEDMLRGAAPPNNVYDATNGTISRGCISRTNKGVFAGSRFSRRLSFLPIVVSFAPHACRATPVIALF